MDANRVIAEWRRKGAKKEEKGMPGLFSTTASMQSMRSGVYEEASTGAVAEIKEFTSTELDA